MNLYTYECASGNLVDFSCSGGGWQLVTNQLPGEIEGMETSRGLEHISLNQDVLILGAHSDDYLYYWAVESGAVVKMLSTAGHPDVEGLVVCKDD
jgi:hypothetical protein